MDKELTSGYAKSSKNQQQKKNNPINKLTGEFNRQFSKEKYIG
jgi:hypothetical protein